MPWLSNAQQTFGTGGAPAQQQRNPLLPPGAVGGGILQRPLAQNPFQVGQDFSRAVGGLPTHTVLQQVNAGQSPFNSQPPSAASPAAGPSAPPAQAGALNAAAPGAFNGNPANGFPGAEVGFAAPTKPLQVGPAPNPLQRVPMQPGPGMAPMPPVRPSPPPPAPQGPPNPFAAAAAGMAGAGPGGAAPGRVPMAPGPGMDSMAAIRAASAGPIGAPKSLPVPGAEIATAAEARNQRGEGREPETPGQTQASAWDALLASSPGLAQSLAAQGASAPAGATPLPAAGGAPPPTGGGTTPPPTGGAPPAGTPPAGTATGVFARDNPASYYTPEGQPAWTVQDIRNDDRGDQRFWAPKPADFAKWPDNKQRQWMIRHYNPYGSQAEYMAQSPHAAEAFVQIYGQGLKGLGQLPSLADWQAPAQPVTIPSNANVVLDTQQGGQYPVDDRVRPLLDTTHELYSNINEMFKQLGEDWFSTKEGNEALTRYRAATTLLGRYGYAYDPVKDIPRGAAGDVGTGDVGTGRDEWNLGNTDVTTKLPDFDKIPGDIRAIFGGDSWKSASPEEKAAMLDAMMQIYLTNEQLANKQKGINVFQPAYEQTLAENNPFRAASEEAALGALKNPNPVDLQGIQNRTSSDYGKSLEQAIQAASGSANRRGLSAGSMAGVAGQLAAENQNALARTLGEQTTAYQMADRQALYDAIRNAGNVNAMYTGGQMTAAQQLAGMISGAYQPAMNPYAAFPDTSANLQAIELQRMLAGQGPVDDKSSLYGAGGAAIGALAALLI